MLAYTLPAPICSARRACRRHVAACAAAVGMAVAGRAPRCRLSLPDVLPFRARTRFTMPLLPCHAFMLAYRQ